MQQGSYEFKVAKSIELSHTLEVIKASPPDPKPASGRLRLLQNRLDLARKDAPEEILKVISTGWPYLTCLLTFRALEISVRRLTTIDSGAPAESKQEAPTSVGASSSGTAFSRGGNSCYAHPHVHGRDLIRSGRAANRPWSGLTSITCSERRPSAARCAPHQVLVRWNQSSPGHRQSSRRDSGVLLPARPGELR